MERSFRFGRCKWLIINGRFHTPPVFRSVLFHFIQRRLTRSTCALQALCQRASGASGASLWLDDPVVGRMLPGSMDGVNVYSL